MAAIDVETMTITERIPTGEVPHPGSGATWMVGDVGYGATTHAGQGLVSIWDLATNEVVGSVETAGSGLFLRSHHDSPYIWADAVFAEEPNKIYGLRVDTTLQRGRHHRRGRSHPSP